MTFSSKGYSPLFSQSLVVSSVEIFEESLMIFVKERITGLHDIAVRCWLQKNMTQQNSHSYSNDHKMTLPYLANFFSSYHAQQHILSRPSPLQRIEAWFLLRRIILLLFPTKGRGLRVCPSHHHGFDPCTIGEGNRQIFRCSGLEGGSGRLPKCSALRLSVPNSTPELKVLGRR